MIISTINIKGIFFYKMKFKIVDFYTVFRSVGSYKKNEHLIIFETLKLS